WQHRLWGPPLDADEGDQEDGAADQAAEDGRAGPAERLGLDEAEDDAEGSARGESESPEVEVGVGSPALGQAESGQRDQDDADRDVDPEDPVPGDPFDDGPADDRSEGDGAAADARPHADRHA